MCRTEWPPRALLITGSVAMECGMRLDQPLVNPQSTSRHCSTKGGIRC